VPKSLTLADRTAILLAKLAASSIRKLNLGLGSNLPGKIARKVSPTVLKNLSAQSTRGVIAVTGTNGKSTTSGILSSILRSAGFTFAHNRQGANLVTGITASMVETASWSGDVRADLCLFEIDEAALPVVAREVHINGVVVTNLFRDQLDRFGELDTTARLITTGVDINKSQAILNADDPNVAQMKLEGKHLFFGIESTEGEAAAGSQSELAYCGNCSEEVSYSRVFYGQLGHWHCPKCNHARPRPDVYASNVVVGATSSRFNLTVAGKEVDCVLPLPGLFNVYNALAAAAAAHWLSVSIPAIRAGLKDYSTLFGRSERIKINDREVIVQLIKNPAGASQAVASCVKDEKARVMIAINDNLADGRDISWLWDADFELLAGGGAHIIVSGQRAQDMAVRMKYAGVDPALISTEPHLQAALNAALAALQPGETLWLMPTYTCLLELQKIFKTMGHAMSGT
jgi:lipid II isoglutaminyl synthase (glutamine-hydrolysing)